MQDSSVQRHPVSGTLSNLTLKHSPFAWIGRHHLAQIGILSLATGVCAVSMLLLSVPPWVTLALVGAAFGFWFIFTYPFWALSLLFVLFFMPMELGHLTAAQLLGMVTILVAFASHLSGRQPIEGGAFLAPLLTFGGVLLLSHLYARHTELIWSSCQRFFTNVLVYLLTIALVASSRRLHNVITTLLIAGTVNGIYGIYTAYKYSASLERAAGFVGNANHLGFLCAFSLPLAFQRYVRASRLMERYGYLALCGIFLAGVVVSASRGAALSLIVGLLVIAFQQRRQLWRLLPIGAIVLAILPIAPEVFHKRVSNLREDVEDSITLDPTRRLTSRGYLHWAGMRVWRDHPLLGVGTGNFGRYFATSNYNPGWQRGVAIPQHNVYLRVLVENGLVGSLIFAWILWRLARQMKFLLFNADRIRSPELRAAAHGLVGSTAVWSAMGLSMDSLTAHELYILIALSFLCCRYARRELSASPSPEA